MNRVILMGRLTADPELRSTPGGVSVTSFNLAVDRDFKNGNGEREADFPTIVAWRNTAEFICRYFHKGKPIIIDGRLQTRSYEDKDSGKKRYVTEVVADAAKFVLSDNSGEQGAPTYGSGQSTNTGAYSGNAGNQGDFEEIDGDEDLPF